MSRAGPARPALPGFKGPGSAKLPSRPFWAPLSPTWPWHRGRRAPVPAWASATLPVRSRCARPSVPRAPSASGGPPSRLPGAPSLSALRTGAGEETLPLRAFYFKYLMIGPGRAESIFSVYHMWRANHGFWRLGGAGWISEQTPPGAARALLGAGAPRPLRGAASSLCTQTHQTYSN